jgi:hypothetical protein
MERKENYQMELRVDNAPSAFTIVPGAEEKNCRDESSVLSASCCADEETVFPLALFEIDKSLFDLGMATWFRLLATGLKDG